MLSQLVEVVSWCLLNREDVSLREATTPITFERQLDRGRPTLDDAIVYERVKVVHDLLGQAYRDLLGHPMMVPLCDARPIDADGGGPAISRN